MVTKRQLIRSVNRSKSRAKFGEQTFGNSVAFTVDGQETFKLIYDKIHAAKTCVYIANYDLDPALRFVRNSSSEWPFGIVSSSKFTGTIGNNERHKHEAYTLQNLLLEKAREGVEVKIIVWEPRLVLRILPGADERGINGRAEEVESINSIAERYGVEKNLMVRIDSTAPTLTSAHHEKIVIIDNEIGFCGGLDLSRGKWDTSSHDYDNPQRDLNSEPWHDVNVMVVGPVLWDLLYHFHQRWIYSISRNVKQARAIKVQSNFTNKSRAGEVPIVALRTWKELNGHGGIEAWYATMFREAKHSIYIENQFPFQNKSITKLLAKRLQEELSLKVIVVGPMEPNLPGFVWSMLVKMSINDVNSNLGLLRKAAWDRVKTYSLISQGISAEKRRQIYVHSKVMIVDDKWITTGSANMDKNGFKDSSELNLGITSPELARQLRVRLWKEHLQVDIKTGFDEGFYAWEKQAQDNGSRALAGQPIKGHVYYYNFEEMKYPAPYPDAKGSKFELL